MALSDLRLSKNMKYTALYTAMRFYEHAPELYSKQYAGGFSAEIDAAKQVAVFDGATEINLNTHESFVALELVDRLFSLGYAPSDVSVKERQVQFKDLTAQC